MSVSNKFLIWDLSTSDLTRAVNPGVEGVFQGLVLSPDDRFAAAWTNNSQTILLNLLTSEQVVMENPLQADGETVKGACLLDTHCILYGQSHWKMMTLQGALVESHEESAGLPGFQLLRMDFAGHKDYHVVFWTGELDDKRLVLVSADRGLRTTPLELHSALVMNRKRDVLYACADANSSDVSLFKLLLQDDPNNGNRKGTLHRQDRINDSSSPCPGDSSSRAEWVKVGSFAASEPLLQLSLSENENFLLGTSALGFCVWNVSSGGQERTDLKLPTGVRNISVRLLHSNSVMLSKGEEFAVAGVR